MMSLNIVKSNTKQLESINTQIKNKIKNHYSNNLIRSRLKFISKQDVTQKDYLNFSSNDYLGFASNQEIISKTQELMPNLGIGSGASNLISGYHTIHQDLENYISEQLKTDQTILFPSGYMANLALSDVLLNLNNNSDHTLAIHDHNNHASIIDGYRLSNCRLARYKHNDIEHLKLILNKYSKINNKFIFTESLFSMDGTFSDLESINKLIINQNNPDNYALIIDESHSFGLFNNGRSISCNLKNKINNQIVMGTFGKAIGTAGAFVSGPKLFIEALIQFARPYIYTTALSPIITAATLHALKLNQQTSEFREKLFNNIEYFNENLAKTGFESHDRLTNSLSPIKPIIINNNKACIHAAEFLYKHKIILTAIRPPTVANNQSRLRITLSANHTKENIDYLLNTLKKLKTEIPNINLI